MTPCLRSPDRTRNVAEAATAAADDAVAVQITSLFDWFGNWFQLQLILSCASPQPVSRAGGATTTVTSALPFGNANKSGALLWPINHITQTEFVEIH